MHEHLTEEDLILHYYGEGTVSNDKSLEACDECRVRYRELQSVLNSVSMPVPEPAFGYGERVWQVIEPKVRRSWWPGWLQPRRLVAAAAMAALVIAAFLAGRYSHSEKAAVARGGGQIRERVLLVAVGDHLDRTQMVLAELMNSSGAGPLNIAPERSQAEGLVESNRLFRISAAAAGESATAAVLEDLERLLLEIAHGPETLAADQLTELRQRIEREGLMFKVRVIRSNLQHERDEPAPPAETKL